MYETSTRILSRIARALFTHSVGYAPPFHGRFDNGRVEGFLPARALEPQDMSKRSPVDFVSLIAKEMGRLHGLRVTATGPVGEAEIWDVLPRWLELAKREWASDIGLLDSATTYRFPSRSRRSSFPESASSSNRDG